MTSTSNTTKLLDDLLAEVRKTTNKLAGDRTRLQSHVAQIAKEIQHKLQEALGGHPLRGCPNLLTVELPIVGYNIRKVIKSARIPFPLSVEEPIDTLILSRDGSFQVVRVSLEPGTGSPADRVEAELFPARTDDFRPEDFPLILGTVVEACAKHLTQAQRTSDGTRRLRDMMNRVLDAIPEDEE